jgi:uncharacterized protein YbjT (DUF2867 family)
MPQKINLRKTAVVFGATGLVGRELIAQLLDSPDYRTVIAVLRKKIPLFHPKLEQVLLADFDRLPEVEDHLHASDYFCCIGTTIRVAGSKEAFRRVDFQIPKQIAELACKLSVKSLMVISSNGAKATSSNFYLRTKGEMEQAVRSAYPGNLKFVRPSLLIGKRDQPRFGETMGIGFMKLFGWMLFGKLSVYRGVKSRTVAAAMIRLSGVNDGRLVYESDELT